MLARAARPQLTINLGVAVTAQAARPILSLKSPLAPTTPMRSPASPALISPTAINTRMNQRGMSTMQQPTYAYPNHSKVRSILKRGSAPPSIRRQLQFCESPQVFSIAAIEDDEYYGGYRKLTREERRWTPRP